MTESQNSPTDSNEQTPYVSVPFRIDFVSFDEDYSVQTVVLETVDGPMYLLGDEEGFVDHGFLLADHPVTGEWCPDITRLEEPMRDAIESELGIDVALQEVSEA